MKFSLSVLAVITAALSAQARETWLEQALQEREASLRFFAENREKSDAAILRLTDEIPQPTEQADTSLPERVADETVAVADGGMLFDVVHARMVYINNVRVNDPRLQLRCADRLYIQLPQDTLEDGKESAKDSLSASATPHGTHEQPPRGSDAHHPPTPIEVSVGTAMVNTFLNKALLIGTRQGENSISIVQEDTHIFMQSTTEQPAQALVDENGDIVLTCGQLNMQWKDSAGNLNRLSNKNGIAYYRAESGKLLLTGESDLSTPEGSIQCTDELCITLKQEPRRGDTDSSIMPQFSDVRIVGINAATAHGNVVAHRPGKDNTAEASVHGDSLVYDGATGECTVTGRNTALRYGDNTLCTNGSISLAANGDITLRGDSVSGNYVRPTENNAPLHGTFSTAGHIQFTAADGKVHMPEGLQLRDEQCELSIGGSVELQLSKAADATVPQRSEVGMLNLAIASYSEIESLCATGGIRLRYTQGTPEQEITLSADNADIDMRRGSAVLTTASAGRTQICYGSSELTAESATGETSLSLDEQGNLRMKGEKLTATLPTNDGPATVHCTDTLTLMRESACLELGAGARVEAPQGRLTASGPLYLTLRPGPEANAHPLLPQFPHLVYNFDGLKQADTEQGGTVQSPQAAMRCSGKIHVLMSDTAAGKSPESAIQLATAEGDVAVSGKDASGRILTAYGDKLSINGTSGEKRLIGKKVILQDKHNTHIASGAGAAVIIDQHNNVRITGAKQSTSATNIRKQIEKQQKSKK